MHHSLWMWGGFLAIVFVLLALDLGLLNRGNKEIKFKSALKTICFYVVLAILFGLGIYEFMGPQQGTEFAMGYLIELTLSVDNVFVFVLVMTHFSVPKQYQYRVLFWGVLGAIILRFIFIILGTALIAKFDWVLYIFGGFLILTGFKMIKASDAEPDMENNFIIRTAKKTFKVTSDYRGSSFFVRENGIRYVTPLFIVLLVIDFVDIVFAFDSIPAIFAITTDPFIVFTSNIFAVLGLRSMYFVLADIIERFKYLKYGLSLILVFIGFKMIINHYYHGNIIPTDFSLVMTVLIIGVSMVYSLIKTRGNITPQPLEGWVPGSEDKNKDN